MRKSRFVTIKEIAAANELSSVTVWRRLQRIGLNECRDRTCLKPIRFHRESACERLKKHGYSCPD